MRLFPRSEGARVLGGGLALGAGRAARGEKAQAAGGEDPRASGELAGVPAEWEGRTLEQSTHVARSCEL